MPTRVFISYARTDQDFVVPLAEQLKGRGVTIWLDQWENQLATDWDRAIDKALRECSHLLIVLSPSSVESREVRGELRVALDSNATIVPVLYKPCDIPRQLRVVQFVDFSGRGAGDQRALDQLVRACTEIGGQTETSPSTVSPAGAVRSVWRRVRHRGPLSVRAKAVGAAALALALVGGGRCGLNLATEARRRLNDAALSSDGAYLATATGQGLGVRGAVRIWSVDSGRETAFIAIVGPPWTCAWSPDNSRLAIGVHDATIHLYDAGTWSRAHSLTGPTDPIRFIEWSPDGTAVATGDFSGSLWVWEAATGAQRFTKPLQHDRIDAVAWSRDSRRIAVGGAGHSVTIADARAGTVVRRLDGHDSVVSTIAFSPDGKLLASGSLAAPYLIVWDEEGKRTDLNGHHGQIQRVAWSPDGHYLASAGQDNLVHIWNRRFELVRRISLGGRFNSGTSLAWSNDGTRLAVGDATSVRIFDPDRDVPVQRFQEPSGDSYGSIEIVGWSANGARLGVFNKDSRTAAVWDVQHGTRGEFRVGLWRTLTE
jgi:WD40 repeat protein